MKDDGMIATLSAFELCNVVDRKLADNVCTEQVSRNSGGQHELYQH